MPNETRTWRWEDEEAFIRKLGKPNLSEKRAMHDRYWSDLTRLQLLEAYLDVCTNLRERWTKPVPKFKTLQYIQEQLDKELVKDARNRRRRERRETLCRGLNLTHQM